MFIDTVLFAIRKPVNMVQMTCILVVFPLIVLLAVKITWIQQVLSIRPLQWIGSYSMEVFMWHFPVQLFISLLNNYIGIRPYEHVYFFITYLILTFGVAVLYKKFEKIPVTKFI